MSRRRSLFDFDVPKNDQNSQNSSENMKMKHEIKEVELKLMDLREQFEKNVKPFNEKKEITLTDEQHVFINSTYQYKEHQRQLVNFLNRFQILSEHIKDDFSVNLFDIGISNMNK